MPHWLELLRVLHVVVFRQLCCVFWMLLNTLLRQPLMIICDTFLTRGRRSHSLFIFDHFLLKIFVLASLKFNLLHFDHKYIKKETKQYNEPLCTCYHLQQLPIHGQSYFFNTTSSSHIFEAIQDILSFVFSVYV